MGYDDCHYRIAQILKQLPSLRLDRLAVLGLKYPRTCYESLDTLIRHSDGWKTLYHISHSFEMLGFRAVFDVKGHTYLPQPEAWKVALDGRDGREARSSVRIYRSSSILDPDKRTLFEQRVGCEQATSEYVKTEDISLMYPGEREMELPVIVRRGAAVDYAEKSPTSFLPTGDIRDDSPARTWAEVKATSRVMSAAYRDHDSEEDEDDGGDVPVDEYEDVLEYTWPPFHFVG